MQRKTGTYYDRNRDAQLAQAKAYRQSRPEYYLWNAAKHRALRKGIEFDLSVNDIVIPEICPVFGTPMESPSVDHFDNSKGYTKDNIRVISNRANLLKSDASLEELQAIVRYMENGAPWRN